MEIISPLIIALLLAYLEFYSRKGIKKNVQSQFSLRLNIAYKWLGIICCFVASFLLNAAINHWNPEIYILAPVLIAVFLFLGFAVLVGYYNYEVVFDSTKISANDWKGKTTRMKWADIENVKFNAFLGYLYLFSGDTKIKVHQYSNGFVDFLAHLESRTKFTIQF